MTMLRTIVLSLTALCVAPTLGSAQTETSTDGVALPGEGGALPRAPMPVGGVDDGSQQALQAMHADSSTKAASQPSSAPATKPAKQPEPHDANFDEPPDDIDEEHCHAHDHGGQKHDHCHDHSWGPKHDHPHEAPPAETDDDEEFGPSSLGDFGDSDTLGVEIRWNGYLRMVLEAIENDARSQFVGRNDGFSLANVRLGMRAQTGDLFAYISLDGAFGAAEDFNDINQELRVRLRDAYLRYELSDYAHITGGRFKSPYDIGQLKVTAFRHFLDAPVETRGVLPRQGFQSERPGMSQGRQLGVMIHKERIGFSEDGFDLGYAMALTNGFTRGLAFNDNDRFAGFARLTGYFGNIFLLNIAGFTDTQTVGELPNLFDEDVKAFEVSFRAVFAGLDVEAQVLYENRQFETSGQTNVNALGAHAQFAYTRWGVTGGYRFATYDPNTSDVDNDDRVIEHTIALNYTLDTLPLRFMLNGTIAQEQSGRSLSNNRIAFLTQFTF